MEQSSGARPEWSRADDVAFVDSGSYVAVLPLAVTPAGAPRLLEGSAAAIWRELDKTPRHEDDIVSDVAAVFEQAPGAVADAVTAFLHELERQGLARHGV